MQNYIMLYLPCAGQEQAELIATKLLDNKLIACANILPAMRSYFVWEGKMKCEEEVLLLAKTKPHLWEKIENIVSRFHEYEVPCLLSYPLYRGLSSYLQWVDKEILEC